MSKPKNDVNVFLETLMDKSHTSYEDVANVLGIEASSVQVRLSQLVKKVGWTAEQRKEMFGHLATGAGKGRKLDISAIRAKAAELAKANAE